MPDNEPFDAIGERMESTVPLIQAARDQVSAAQLRKEALVVSGRLGKGRDDSSSLPRKPLSNYRLLRELHRGGQATVFLALQESTDRRVAVKVFRHGSVESIAELARFELEVEVLGRIKHPNVVTIYDCGRSDDGVFLVMDYVAGRPLDAYMAQEKPPLRDTLGLFAKICDGVNAAHLRGVIHRDLKPSNICVDQDGEPRILDFGLAKLEQVAPGASFAEGMTMTGQFIGSLPWASPEQTQGQSDAIDVRTDVYSLGVTFYQLLTGKFPYPVGGRMDDVVRHIAMTNPARPSTIDNAIENEVETILFKCLSKEPERRYQSAGEVARDIRHYLAGEPIDAKRDSLGYVLRKQLRRHRVLVAVGSVLGMAVLLSSAVAWVMYVRAARAAVDAGRSERQARQAEREAKSSLGDAYLAEARALRAGQEVGHRAKRLDVLAKAAKLNDSVLELRNEVIASLAQADLVIEKTYAQPPDSLFSQTVVKAGSLALGTRTADILVRPRLNEPAGEYRISPPDDGDEIAALDFSPDGRFLIVMYQKRYSHNVRLRLWEVASRRWLWELPFPGQFHRLCFDFSPDGVSIAVTHPDRVIRYHRLHDAAVTRVFESGFSVWSMLHLRVRSANPALVLADQAKSRLVVWDLDSDTAREFPLPSAPRLLAQSEDGHWLAVGCFDNRIRVYRPVIDSLGRPAITDPATDSPHDILGGHQYPVGTLHFSLNGNLLFSRAGDETTRIWDVLRGRERFAPMPKVHIIGADGDRIVLADDTGDPGVSFQRLETSSICRTVRVDWEQPTLIDDRLLAIGGDELTVWDWQTGVKQTTLSAEPIAGVRVLAGGLLASTRSGRLMLWPIERAAQDLRFGEPHLLWEHTELVDKLCVTPDERLAFVADDSDRIWRVPLDDPSAATMFASQLGARPMDISPDGRRLAVGHWRGERVVVYSVDDGDRLFSLETPGATHAFADFVPRAGGHDLLIVSTPDEYRFIDSASYALRHTMARSGWLGYFAVTWDGDTALVTRTGGTPVLIDLASFEVLAELTLPEANCTIKQSVFDPRGASLIMTTNDNTVFIWDIRAIRQHLARLGLDWQ